MNATGGNGAAFDEDDAARIASFGNRDFFVGTIGVVVVVVVVVVVHVVVEVVVVDFFAGTNGA